MSSEDHQSRTPHKIDTITLFADIGIVALPLFAVMSSVLIVATDGGVKDVSHPFGIATAVVGAFSILGVFAWLMLGAAFAFNRIHQKHHDQ